MLLPVHNVMLLLAWSIWALRMISALSMAVLIVHVDSGASRGGAWALGVQVRVSLLRSCGSRCGGWAGCRVYRGPAFRPSLSLARGHWLL